MKFLENKFCEGKLIRTYCERQIVRHFNVEFYNDFMLNTILMNTINLCDHMVSYFSKGKEVNITVTYSHKSKFFISFLNIRLSHSSKFKKQTIQLIQKMEFCEKVHKEMPPPLFKSEQFQKAIHCWRTCQQITRTAQNGAHLIIWTKITVWSWKGRKETQQQE